MHRIARTLLAVALVVVAPVVARAHGGLKSSVPANRARLSVAPRELRLTFSERPELAVTRARLLGPDSAEVALDPLRVAPDSRLTVIATVRGPLVAGAYTVRWQMAGADGHPTSGAFRFTIEPGAAGLAARAPDDAADSTMPPAPVRAPAVHHDTTTFPESGAFGAESPAYAAIRWLQFVALLVVVGAVAFRFVVLRVLAARGAAAPRLVAPASARAARIALVGAVALGVSVVLRLYAQSVAMHGAAGSPTAGMLRMIGGTVWGRAWILQAIATLVTLAGLAAARRGARGGWALAALGVLALGVTPALSGHAAAAPSLTALAVLADAGHVLGAGGWIGSLLFVVAAGVPSALALGEPERGPAVADLVNAFSPTALVFAGVTLATGLFAAWIHLGGLAALWQTRYGQLLLLKVAGLLALAATGAYNWLRVRPSLGRIEGAARLGRSSAVELAIGVVVLAVTAVLVATPTAMDLSAMGMAAGH